MPIFYSLAIRFYYVLLYLASFFNQKAKFWIQGRKNWESRFKPTANKKRAWLHFASLGEFEQGKPLLQAIRKQHPEKEIIITFFSPSGYEVRKNSNLGDYILYLPLDTPANAQRFLDIFTPELVIFNKYEYWFNFYRACADKGVPVYVSSAIFRPNQIFFKWYGAFNRRILGFVQHFFVQNEESAQLLASIGFNNATVCGDTRFDSVLDLAKSRKDFPLVEAFKAGSKLIVAGSTWPADEALIHNYAELLPKDWKIIFAPHEIDEEKITGLQKLLGEKALRYSATSMDQEMPLANYRYLVIDNIGMLSSLYSYGELAYIGGGFGVGIHNTLEAAAWGLPVVFGPNYQKFQEAKDLIAFGGGFSVKTQNELNQVFNVLVNDKEDRAKAGAIAKEYVAAHTGASAQIMAKIF